jgi:hypothetical protein
MSLILKGIDMPETNETRMIAITSNGVAFFSTVKGGETGKSERAEAIQIPKDHGRLIDGDKLDKLVHEWNPVYTYGRIAFTRAIENAPTILEVEE